VQHHLNSDISADWAVHDVYHSIGGGIVWGDPDFQNHAVEVLNCFAGKTSGHTQWNWYAGRTIKVSTYDMADAKPRPPKGTAIYTPTTPDTASAMGPRQVALRLSWFATRNLKGSRGGIYLGPFKSQDTGNPAPGFTIRTAAVDLGAALNAVGGVNVSHVLYHTAPPAKAGTTSDLTDYWCDDSWDIIRRRKTKATTRVTAHP
jgi:hypothetical protein